MQYKIIYSCISHIGNIRALNQDNYICDGQYTEIDDTGSELPLCGFKRSVERSLFGIFDGMGGEECGEVAAYIAAEVASRFAFTKDGIADLKKYCTDANDAICKYAQENAVSSMGTTAAMLMFTRKEILLCNIGDSKIFKISQKGMHQISKDHVVVSVFGQKPPLSQNLGIPPSDMIIDPFVSKGSYKSGDKYLICSDGLTDMVAEYEIAEIINNSPIDTASLSLLNKALENGGKDNITIILLEIKKDGIFSSLKKKAEGKKK